MRLRLRGRGAAGLPGAQAMESVGREGMGLRHTQDARNVCARMWVDSAP